MESHPSSSDVILKSHVTPKECESKRISYYYIGVNCLQQVQKSCEIFCQELEGTSEVSWLQKALLVR